MSCKIKINNKGEVIGVNTPEGVPSRLFEEVHSIPFLAGAKDSAQMVSSAYASNLPKNLEKYEETGEPKLFFKTPNGKVFDNLEEAILNDAPGVTSIGFKKENDNELLTIGRFNTGNTEVANFIHSQVREGNLSAKRLISKEDGSTKLQGKGEYNSSREMTALEVRKEMISQLGIGNIDVANDGSISVTFPTEASFATKGGVTELILTKDIPTVAKDYDNAAELLLEYKTKEQAIQSYNDKKAKPITNATNDSSLVLGLKNFLGSMGFTKTTLNEYDAAYNTKHGKDPDVKALADIANSVVAFSEENPEELQFSEEVSHIAIEAYSDQNSIISALAVVHLTPEYNEYAAYYTEKYKNAYTGTKTGEALNNEIDEKVRKEILGKILAKQLAGKTDNNSTNEDYIFLLTELKKIWSTFVEWVKGNTKAYHKDVIADLNKKIADSILSNKMQDFQTSLKGNTNIFYDAMDASSKRTEFILKNAKKIIEDLAKGLEERVPRQSELDKIEDDMLEIDVMRSVNAIVGITSNKMGILESNIAEADSNNQVLDNKSEDIYTALSEKLIPVLNVLKLDLENLLKDGGITSKSNQDFAKTKISEIDRLVIRIADVGPKIDKEKGNRVNQMMQEVLKNTSMTEQQKENFLKKSEGNSKDISFFGKLLGLISESSNPIMQMLHAKVVGLQDIINVRVRSRVTDVLNDVKKRDLNKHSSKTIKYDKNGKPTYYRLNPWDWSALDNSREANKMELAAMLSGKTVEEVTKLSKKKTFKEIVGSEENFREFKKGLKKWSDENIQKRYNPEYYTDKQAKFDLVGVSEETQETMANLNSRAFEVTRPYMNQLGIIDKSKMTEGDKKTLADIRRDKEFVKSAYNTFGQVKEGLRVVKKEDLTAEEIELYFPKAVYPMGISEVKGDLVVLDKNVKKEDLHEEARTAYDMNNLVVHYLQQLTEGTKTTDAIEEFYRKIAEVESLGNSAYDWTIANATLTLSDEYYDVVSNIVGYERRAAEYINSLPLSTEDQRAEVQALKETLKSYNEASRKRKDLIKQNRNLNNPIETNAHDMSPELRVIILELDDELAELRKDLGIPKEELGEEEAPTAERTLSEDYGKMLTEFGTDREVEFALKHMSNSNRRKTEKFIEDVTGLLNGKKQHIQSRFEKFIQEMIDAKKVDIKRLNGEITNKDEVLKALTTEYARLNVGSYFQRFTPIGYDAALEKLKSGEVSIAEFLKDREGVISKHPDLANIKINPDYSWLQDVSNEKYINKNYKKGGYYVKPDIKYLDNEFFERYGITKEEFLALEDEDISKLTPRKNQEEYELLLILTKLREDSQKLYKNPESQNKYLRVQKSSSSFEKLLTKGSIKAKATDLYEDLINDRVDEKAYGEVLDGLNLAEKGSEISIKSIPKYYQDKLESPEMISKDELASALQDYKQAVQYEERGKIEKDLKALEWKISQQNFIGNGSSILKKIITKKGATSNYLEKAREYVDNHLYGIQQTRTFKTVVLGKEVDLTRLVSKIQNFASFTNLGFNLFVDITGATTGLLNNIVDRFTGDYYHKSSARRSTGQVAKYLPGYVAEIGKTQKNTKMSAILEYFGNIDINYRIENTKFGRAGRILQRSPYVFSKLSNMAVTPRILFSILNDHRFHEGRFLSFNEFTSVQNIKEGMTKKQIESDWKALEKDSYYDNLDISAEDIKPNAAFLSKYDTIEAAEKAFEEVRLKVVTKSKQVTQLSDGVLTDADRVAAQRDVLTNLFMMHRGWLLINLAKRFKGSHYNLTTGQQEEGHYITAFNALKEVVKASVGKGSFKEYTSSLETNQKRNLKKVAIESAIMALLIMLGNALMEGEDDEDEEKAWLGQLGRLISLRTLAEVSSSQVFGLPGTVTEIARSPITIISTIDALIPITWITEIDEYDKEENNKLLKIFKKASIVKRYGQYTDMQKTIDNFIYYNQPTLLGVGTESAEKTDETGADYAQISGN